MTCWKGCWSIAFYCRKYFKYFKCYFKFSLAKFCWRHKEFNFCCCRTPYGMVDAKSEKKTDKSLFSLPQGPLCLMTQRSSSWSIAGISMIEHYCCVKFINLKLLYRCSTRPPSSNRLNVWMLFELHGSTMTLSSGNVD